MVGILYFAVGGIFKMSFWYCLFPSLSLFRKGKKLKDCVYFWFDVSTNATKRTNVMVSKDRRAENEQQIHSTESTGRQARLWSNGSAYVFWFGARASERSIHRRGHICVGVCWEKARVFSDSVIKVCCLMWRYQRKLFASIEKCLFVATCHQHPTHSLAP